MFNVKGNEGMIVVIVFAIAMTGLFVYRLIVGY